MKEPAADGQSVDEYLDRIRDRFEEASARVLGMAGPTGAPPQEESDLEEQSSAGPPEVSPPAELDTPAGPEDAVGAGVSTPFIETPAAARHRGHRTDPRPKPVPPKQVRRPVGGDSVPAESVAAPPEPATPPSHAATAEPSIAAWRQYAVPIGGIAFVLLVGIWAMLWFRSDSAPPPPSFQSRVEAALTGEQFADVAARLDGNTVVLVGTVSDASVATDAIGAVADVDGVGEVDSRIVVLSGGTVDPVPVGTSTVTADVVAALSANGFRGLDATVTDGIATLSGTLRSSELYARAAEIAQEVDGVDEVVSAVDIVPLRPAEEIVADAQDALARSGYSGLSVSVSGDTATVTGVADRSAIKSGFFASIEDLRSRLLAVDGVGVVRTRLQLKGDEALLRNELKALIDTQPVVFQSGSADLEPLSFPTLEQAAEIILSQPGLRIFIAGHTDTIGSQSTNEQLSQARGDSVRSYLISLGVPPNRLFVVAYGELFPGQESTDADRRVEFEVGP